NIVLADGSDYNFAATATDAAGHTSGASNTLVIHDDQTAPNAPLIVTTAPSQNTALSIDIAGSAEANSTVTLLNGASQIGMTTADGSGNWHVNGITLVDGGHYSFTATPTDAAGNSSCPSNPLTFDEVQNHAPVTSPVTLTAIAEDSGPRLITQAELLANASDVDGPALTAVNLAVSSGSGTLTNNNDGT